MQREMKPSKSVSFDKDTVCDYKDVKFLRSATTPSGKLQAARVLGCSKSKQKQISTAVKRARFIALVPYCELRK